MLSNPNCNSFGSAAATSVPSPYNPALTPPPSLGVGGSMLKDPSPPTSSSSSSTTSAMPAVEAATSKEAVKKSNKKVNQNQAL